MMEFESKLYLGVHYDTGTLHYHYSKLPPELLHSLTTQLECLIKALQQEVYFHIMDSTALSTSVRTERTREGQRKKEKLTQKYHTFLGYDPPSQCVIVENMLATDHHTSDGDGGERMLKEGLKGYSLGDKAYETYALTEATEEYGLVPIYKPQKRQVRKTYSAKARRKGNYAGNPARIYKEIRGIGEVLYGAATKCGLIHTQARKQCNRERDALVIGLRQNLLCYLRAKIFLEEFLEKLVRARNFLKHKIV